MPLLYPSAADYIRYRTFEVWVPAYYQWKIPDAIVNPPRGPLPKPNRFKMVPTRHRPSIVMRQMADPDQMQLANYAIQVMLDMHQKQVEFELRYEADVVEILEELDRYLMTIRGDVLVGHQTAIAYAKLVVSWRSKVYDHYYRYMRTHPEALDRLYPNESKTGNIFHLMNQAGVLPMGMKTPDPLKAKARPPYEIPGNPEVNAKPVIHEDLYGISPSGTMVDDGKDFNFDDFLKK